MAVIWGLNFGFWYRQPFPSPKWTANSTRSARQWMVNQSSNERWTCQATDTQQSEGMRQVAKRDEVSNKSKLATLIIIVYMINGIGWPIMRDSWLTLCCPAYAKRHMGGCVPRNRNNLARSKKLWLFSAICIDSLIRVIGSSLKPCQNKAMYVVSMWAAGYVSHGDKNGQIWFFNLLSQCGSFMI